jgi:hypothetical protein
MFGLSEDYNNDIIRHGLKPIILPGYQNIYNATLT